MPPKPEHEADIANHYLPNAIRNLTETMGAVVEILLYKGVCTEQEYEVARLRMVAAMDQGIAHVVEHGPSNPPLDSMAYTDNVG